MHKDSHDEKKSPAQTARVKLLAFAVKAGLPILIVLTGLGFLEYQINSRPKADRQQMQRQARLITVETVRKQQGNAVVTGMGTVAPSRQVVVCPEISGVITSIDAAVIPGGSVKAGQILYTVDCRDYQAVVKQRESELARAQLDLKMEEGNQMVARQEYELLEDIIQESDMELVLRKPQLESARQSLEAARAAFEKAELDVERCSIRAPFNAIIKSRLADLGARVSPSTPLVELTGTDEYWIEVKVFMNQLGWVEIPSDFATTGSAVRIYNSAIWPDTVYMDGKVIRLLAQLEEKGLLARLLVAVEDPLHLRRPSALAPLLIGSYVRAEIIGRPVSGVVAVSRAHVRDGDTVWVMNEDDALEIRPVKIAYSNPETVFITDGLQDGERLVTTMISAPVNGLPLRVEPAAQSADSETAVTSSALPGAGL
ncbi:MAG: efflux RND transporter periplasmic adaptor subunit [Planctomycetaceae bacterium]|nr:efflux RND transporter periplasmic adaptor subunit [Planctomycetaceae bacterium]